MHLFGGGFNILAQSNTSNKGNVYIPEKAKLITHQVRPSAFPRESLAFRGSKIIEQGRFNFPAVNNSHFSANI